MPSRIGIKQMILALLTLETLVFLLATTAFIRGIHNIYTDLVYDNAQELVYQYARNFDERLDELYSLTGEFLSNGDIQRNLTAYASAPDSLDGSVALGNLYTQIFTRTYGRAGVNWISFTFNDGRHVDANGSPSNVLLLRAINAAHELDGRCGWLLLEEQPNCAVLYQLIKDTSSYGFPPLGVLMIQVDFGTVLRELTAPRDGFTPELVCVAENQLMTSANSSLTLDDLQSFLGGDSLRGVYDLHGERYFISAKDSAREPWELLYLQSEKQVLSGLNGVNTLYIMALIGLAIVIFAIGVLAATTITRPLLSLRNTMKNVEQGDYKLPTEGFASGRLVASEVEALSESYTHMVRKIDTLINEVYLSELSGLKIKYKMLQQHINPHFLYNTLDTINWKAIAAGNKDVSLMVRSLSNMLRTSISGQDIVTLQDELNFLDAYLAIQTIRFEERLSYGSDIDQGALDCHIPKLTLQPLIENCISHNLEAHSGICSIMLSAHVIGDSVEIEVIDNGKGADLDKVARCLAGEPPEKENGIGLFNIQQRLTIAFGEQCTLLVDHVEPHGTRVRMQLPRKEEPHI